MGPPPTPADAFAGALQRCSPATFETFVIALYEARGWEADPGGERVRLTRRAPPGETQVLRIDHPAASDPTDPAAVDAVVTPARGPPPAIRGRVECLTADDLHRMLRFGLDRPTAARLVGEHLDVPPRTVLAAASPPADHGRPPRRRAGQDRNRPSEPPATTAVGSMLAAALVLVVVVVAAIGAASGPVDTVDARADPGSHPSVPDPFGGRADGLASAPPGAVDRVADRPRYLAATPTCDRPPGLVVAVIVGALGAAGPDRADGIGAAWRFSIPIGSEPGFERFLGRPAFDLLFDHETAAFGPVLDHGGDVVSQRVRLSSPTATRSYRFFLTRQGFGDRAACWFLAGVLVDDARTARPAS